jgi:hypothetical protein
MKCVWIDDTRKRNLNQENKDTYDVASWKLSVAYISISVVFKISAVKFISIVKKYERHKCQTVKIIPQQISPFTLIVCIVDQILVVVSL